MLRAFLSRWALPASLALNVFLGTVLYLQPAPNHRHPGGPPPSPLKFIERLAGELPPADAVVLREVVGRHVDEFERQNKTWGAVPHRVKAALEAPVLDVEALRAALIEGRDAHRRMDDSLVEVVIEAASGMSPEGRRTVARWRPPPPPPGPPPG